MKDKRIMLVTGQLGNGGLERQLYYLVKYLLRENYIVECVVWNYKKGDYYNSIFDSLLGDDFIKLTNKNSLKKIFELREKVLIFKPDIVFSFSAFINFPVFLSSVFTRSQAIGGLRTSASRYISGGGVKAYLNLLFPGKILVNNKVAISEIENNFLLKHFIITSYFPNVIDIRQYNIRNKESNGKFKTVSVGSLRPVKRIDRLIGIFNLLGNEFDLEHHHYGTGSEYKDLLKLIKNNNLTDKVILKGESSELPKILCEYDILIHMSEYEGTPNVIMEAMASGLPVITTDCGDSKYLVQNGVNGYVVSPFNTEDFCHRINDLLSNEELLRSFRQNSRNEIIGFGIENFGIILTNALKKLNISIE